MFFCEFYIIFKNTFFTEHSQDQILKLGIMVPEFWKKKFETIWFLNIVSFNNNIKVIFRNVQWA